LSKAPPNPSAELWKQAQSTMDRIKSGELRVSPTQYERLQSVLEGYSAWAFADSELKRGMIGLLYEHHVYVSKVWFLERLGVENHWAHPLLQEMKQILYEETDEFKLEDYMENKK
jgi:hypothetical protein